MVDNQSMFFLKAKDMSLEQQIILNFGPLLALDEVAVLLKRSRGGLQYTLDAGHGDFADALRAARRKIGRRNLFPASEIAKILEQK